MSQTATAQSEVKIWEFSPYEVEVFYMFDADVGVSPIAQQIWLSQVQAGLERTFRAAWHVRLTPLRSELAPLLLRRFDSFSVADLQAQPATAELQTTDDQNSAGDPDLQSAPQQGFSQSQPEGYELVPEKNEQRVSADGRASESATPRKNARRHSLWHQRDKLFFLRVSRQGDEISVQVRELDGPLQFFGPTLRAATVDWSYAAHLASATIVKAFAPVARVEDAESKTAELRLRAGGLILPPENPAAVANPAAVVVGDVMQPVVRRDDRNGVPVLLQPLPWTYAAITGGDGVKLEANVYTYSGGPGLQGRKNRRTQRLLLKVRPQTEQTDLELVLRNSGQPQAGCFIYSRDLLTDQFELLGRTDWRGRLTIAQPLLDVEVLPEEVRAARAAAKRAAAAAAEEKAAGDSTSGGAGELAEPDDSTSDEASVAAEPDPTASDAVLLAEGDWALIPLRAPLLLLYVKQGSAVLAKLPMVPGLAPVETAELPDDRRRLLAEAFVRGFQGEILDVVGMRNLLAAKVKQQMARDQRDAAKSTVEALRRLKNYTQLADELEAIQRRMLDETDGPIPLAAKSRIDGMFQTTRTMLQKYLQDNLLTQSEQAIAAAASSAASSQP